jgi:glycosyltransferase involved in cell wall biosynthesis
VFAGRLHREKGPDLLIEALSLIERPPHAYLLGSGAEEPALRRLVRARGLGGLVHFRGWQSCPGRSLADAAACVVPSRHDAWSQTAVLAMGLGTPVVATAVEGLPAVLAARRGLLVPPADPAGLAHGIEALLDGRVQPDREAARRYALEFTPERVAASYAAEYEALAARPAYSEVVPLAPAV